MSVQSFFGRFCFAVVISLLIGSSQQAAAQQQSDANAAQEAAAATGDSETYVLRTYDVSDLLRDVQDRPYSDELLNMPGRGGGFGGGGGGMGGGGMGGGGGGYFSVPEDTGDLGASNRLPGAADPKLQVRFAQFGGGGMGGGGAVDSTGGNGPITIDDLVRVMATMVAPDTWGDQAKIEQLGRALVVWQTPPVHEQIENFLVQIHRAVGERKTLTVDARWLPLNSAELEQLAPASQAGARQIDRNALKEFTRRPGSIRGLTNCFSGQLVYVISGTKRNIVAGWIPVVGALDRMDAVERLVSTDRGSRFQLVADATGTRDVGYQPISVMMNFGTLLEIRPTLVSDNASVIVDLKSTHTVSNEPTAEAGPVAESMTSIAPTIDRVAVETLELATTLKAPLGEPVLVGGLTFEKGAGDEIVGDPDSEQRQLYLVLEIRTQ